MLQEFKDFKFDEGFIDVSYKIVTNFDYKINEYNFIKNHYISVDDLEVNQQMNKFIKQYGKSDNLIGELVRAFKEIENRFFSDADVIGAAWGRDFCNPPAYFIGEYTCKEIQDLIFHNLAFRGENKDDLFDKLETLSQDEEFDDEYYELQAFIQDDAYPNDDLAISHRFCNIYEKYLFLLKLYLIEFIQMNKDKLEKIIDFEPFYELNNSLHKDEILDMFAENNPNPFKKKSATYF